MEGGDNGLSVNGGSPGGAVGASDRLNYSQDNINMSEGNKNLADLKKRRKEYYP